MIRLSNLFTALLKKIVNSLKKNQCMKMAVSRLYCVRLSNVAPFCKNHAKLYLLYFDAKQ